MTITIEVQSLQVAEKDVTSKRTGKAYRFREQNAWIHMGKPYPVEIRLPLEVDQPPYPLGSYHIDMPTSLYVDKFRNVSLGRMRLIPAPAAG